MSYAVVGVNQPETEIKTYNVGFICLGGGFPPNF